MLSPLARSLALRVVLRIMGEVRAGTRADQWSPISPARASGDPPGAGRGCAPSPANPRRSFPAGQLDLALEECATTRSLPTLHPIAWPGQCPEGFGGRVKQTSAPTGHTRAPGCQPVRECMVLFFQRTPTPTPTWITNEVHIESHQAIPRLKHRQQTSSTNAENVPHADMQAVDCTAPGYFIPIEVSVHGTPRLVQSAIFLAIRGTLSL
ncbi:PREDICTED: uncharacterized protein LOC109386666 [Hipposideros armiger]|uniref:Uncharacterized protein LOC109386666 n=1 Tax=Hipposideros armiger TaxID=186990 RepID=A0A8B7S203_HIPAR|nr:PREDICTED: uncharacterized protein LOC109386666 [Hipposideros armiger]